MIKCCVVKGMIMKIAIESPACIYSRKQLKDLAQIWGKCRFFRCRNLACTKQRLDFPTRRTIYALQARHQVYPAPTRLSTTAQPNYQRSRWDDDWAAFNLHQSRTIDPCHTIGAPPASVLANNPTSWPNMGQLDRNLVLH